MNKIWEKFIDLHSGLFLAREPFEDLCYAILDKHFPGRAIVSNGDLKNSNPKKLSVFFLSKLFVGDLTNSRKGQIRKAFKKFIAYQKESKQKTRAWVFCVSSRLDNEEMMWWISWKTKTSQEYGIDIQLFDGDSIIENAKKYNLYDKWFLNKEEIKPEDKENNEDFSFELIPDDSEEEKEIIKVNLHKEEEIHNEIPEENHKNKEEKIHNEIPEENHKNKEEKIHNEIPEKNHKNKKGEKPTEKENHLQENKKKEAKNNPKKKNNKNNKNIKPAKKITFDFKYEYLKKEFDRIKLFAEKLSKEEIAELAEINGQKDWDKSFDFEENLDAETMRLFYKAKSYEIRKKHIQSIFVYEYIFKREDYKEILKFKLEESYKALQKAQVYVQAFLYELEGDIYYIRKNKIKAVELYEKSFKLNRNNKLYARKFYETLGDNQIENDLPEKAVNSYKNAKEIDRTNEELEQKFKNAKYLSRGKKFFKQSPFSLLNIFLAPFAYWAAHSTIKDDKTKKKLDSSSKKSALLTGFVLLIFIAFFFIFNDNFTLKNKKQNKKQNKKESNLFTQTNSLIKPMSLENIAIASVDEIMSTISLNNIHLVDTAIADYKRALNYNSTSELAYTQLKKAETYQKEYFSKAQANILLDSAGYFVSMRRESENLRLFKYLFKANDKSQGKYGYVDSNMHIVIPPVYDFNYNLMYNGSENFKNGQAIVCLVSSKGDTNYYKIDKYNHFKTKL